MDKLGSYDVVVIGAGHAGIEAAHAAATLGARTAVFTLSLDFIGNMPCNPSIGGTAKGHLVREVDALGGLMGIAADATFLQSRMLNRGKGPAVHSLRVQTDRKRYHMWMKHALEKTPNLDIHQAEIVAVDIQEGKVCGVITNLNGYYSCKALVIATGTTLGGRIFAVIFHESLSAFQYPDGLFFTILYKTGPAPVYFAILRDLFFSGIDKIVRVRLPDGISRIYNPFHIRSILMSDQIIYVRNHSVRIKELLQESQLESQLADAGCFGRKQMIVAR